MELEACWESRNDYAGGIVGTSLLEGLMIYRTCQWKTQVIASELNSFGKKEKIIKLRPFLQVNHEYKNKIWLDQLDSLHYTHGFGDLAKKKLYALQVLLTTRAITRSHK